MNRVLKYAWYQLIVIITATLVTAVTLAIIAVYWRGKEFNALIPLGLFAMVHLYKVFFPLKAGEIAFDERDEQIMNQATKMSFMVFWYAFVLSCLVPLLVIGNGTIHVMYLGWAIFSAAIILRISWSVSVILQYGGGVSDDNNDQVLKGGAA
ncbi:MAG: hypothetical protein ACYSOV_02315 [Planctomycetota bacterium]|jgi:hypothetical protein